MLNRRTVTMSNRALFRVPGKSPYGNSSVQPDKHPGFTLMFRRMRRLSAASLILSMAVYTTRAAANDLYTFDILGFRLGLSPDEVQQIAAGKLKEASIEPIQKRLILGSFSIDDALLGTRIKEGKDTPWYNALNKEFVQINYSLDAAHKVIYINRVRRFDNNSAPAIQSLMASLTEKYGPPSATEGGGTQPTLMYWNSNSAFPATGRLTITSPLHGCGAELFSDADPFGQMRNGTINFNPQYIDNIWPKCGAVMIVRIEPLVSNNQLAYSITASVGDFRQLQASAHSMLEALKRGETERLNSGAARGSLNKAPL